MFNFKKEIQQCFCSVDCITRCVTLIERAAEFVCSRTTTTKVIITWHLQFAWTVFSQTACFHSCMLYRHHEWKTNWTTNHFKNGGAKDNCLRSQKETTPSLIHTSCFDFFPLSFLYYSFNLVLLKEVTEQKLIQQPGNNVIKELNFLIIITAHWSEWK